MSFSSLHGNELDARSPDLQLGATIDRDVGLEAEYVVDVEAFAEEWLVENARCSAAACDLFPVVFPRIKLQAGVQGAKILVPAYVIPMGVRDENRRQFRQVGCIRSQCLVGGLGRVRSRARVDADQFLPIVRYHEIIFRELETRQRVYAARHYLTDASRDKCVSGCVLLRERSDERNRPIKVLVAALEKIVLRPGLVPLRDGKLSQMIVDFSQPSCMRRFVGVFQAPA